MSLARLRLHAKVEELDTDQRHGRPLRSGLRPYAPCVTRVRALDEDAARRQAWSAAGRRPSARARPGARARRAPAGAGRALDLTDDELHDTLLFVHRGWGPRPCARGAAAGLVPAGETASLTAGAEGLECVPRTLGAGTDLHAPMGATEPVVALDHVEPGQATGARSFQVLHGPHNGSTRATLFVGYIPPGRRRGTTTSTTRSSGSCAAREGSTSATTWRRRARRRLPAPPARGAHRREHATTSSSRCSGSSRRPAAPPPRTSSRTSRRHVRVRGITPPTERLARIVTAQWSHDDDPRRHGHQRRGPRSATYPASMSAGARSLPVNDYYHVVRHRALPPSGPTGDGRGTSPTTAGTGPSTVIGIAFVPGVRESSTLLRLARLARVVRIVRLCPDPACSSPGVARSIPAARRDRPRDRNAAVRLRDGRMNAVRRRASRSRGNTGRAMMTLVVMLTLEELPLGAHDGRWGASVVVGVLRQLHDDRRLRRHQRPHRDELELDGGGARGRAERRWRSPSARAADEGVVDPDASAPVVERIAILRARRSTSSRQSCRRSPRRGEVRRKVPPVPQGPYSSTSAREPPGSTRTCSSGARRAPAVELDEGERCRGSSEIAGDRRHGRPDERERRAGAPWSSRRSG